MNTGVASPEVKHLLPVLKAKQKQSCLFQKKMNYFSGGESRVWWSCVCVCVCVYVCVLVAQSCPTLWDPMDCSPPGSSVHGILLATILEWVAIPFSRGSSWLKDQTKVSCIAGRFFTIWAIKEVIVMSYPIATRSFLALGPPSSMAGSQPTHPKAKCDDQWINFSPIHKAHNHYVFCHILKYK